MIARMTSTGGTLPSVLLVILASAVSLFARAPQQQIRSVTQVQKSAKQPTSVPATSHTAPDEGEVRVAVIVIPPNVIEKNGSLTGFSIDLWEAIATRLRVKTSY